MIDAPDRHGTYVAYMLRLWQAGSRDGLPVWRASLESPHTGERLAFADIKALFAFLTERTSSLPETSRTSELGECADADDCTGPPGNGG